jgi:hypothetical protein
MTKSLLFCAAVVAGVFFAGSIAEAQGPKSGARSFSGPLTIDLKLDFRTQPPLASWSSSGAIVDAGSFTFTSLQWRALPSPVVGVWFHEVVLTGRNGKITIKCNGKFHPATSPPPPDPFSLRPVPDTLPAPSPQAFIVGTWKFGEGTNAYAHLTGEGHFWLTLYGEAPDLARVAGRAKTRR